MGQEKSTTRGQQTQTVTPQPTAEERELNRLLLERQRAAQSGMIESQEQGLNLINQLLTGQALPGYLGNLPGGISPEAIGSQASQLARQNLAGFQQQGLADSGVAFRETAADIANRVLLPSETFNLQNLSQLLNLAVGGQAQIQAPITQQGLGLSQALAGLRPVTSSGTQIGRGTQSYDFFTSPLTGAIAGGFAGGFGQGFGGMAGNRLFAPGVKY